MPRLWQQLAERRQANDPTKPLTDETLISVLNAGWTTDAGVTVTPETALRVTAVYRAVSLLAGVLGALPLHAYRRAATGRERLDNTLLDVPHPDKTPMEVWEYVFMSLLTHGNAYVRKLRDGVGRIVQLWPLHPGAIKVKQDDGWRTADNPVGKRFYLGEPGNNGDTTYWTPHEVMHVPGMSYNGLYGLSPLQQARQAIGLGVAAQQFGSRMFDRGGLIPGVLQTDLPLEEGDAERLQRRWQEKTSGADNQWKIPVLTHGVAFHPIALPPADVQMIEQQRWSVVEIARLFGIPPHLLADVERSTSWGTGIEAQGQHLLTYTADPWLVRVEQRVSREVVRPTDRQAYVKFTRAALLRADTTTRYLAYQRGIQFGWLSADDIRELEDMNPLPDGAGGTYWQQGNMQAVYSPNGNVPQETTE